MSKYNKRLKHEMEKINELIKEQKKNSMILSAMWKDTDIYSWTAFIKGPIGSPFEKGIYEIDIKIPVDYPMNPPKCVFKTKVYHPNVGSGGDICVDILKSEWSPVMSISKVLESICSLLDDPNPNSPLNSDAASTFSQNKKEYTRIVEKYIKDYCPKC